MAHYDAHKGRGYDGYGIKEPIYGGRPAAAMAYFSTEEISSYEESAEKHVTYDGYTRKPELHRSSIYPNLKKGDEYDHPSAYGAHHGGHPRNNFRDGRGGRFSSDDDSSDDEVECRDGVCYPKPKHGARQGYDYGKEKNKTNGHAAGNYPVQQYTDQPKKDPYHHPSNGHAAGNYPAYNAPAHTKPTTDASYDRYAYPAADNYTHSKNEPYAVPAPIKTRPDLGESGRGSPVAAMAQWTPFATSSPKKGHQPQSAPPMSRRAAIDSETAAKKYGGVFVK